MHSTIAASFYLTLADVSMGCLQVASHGKGVLAEFGSVAKYCQEHSQAPVRAVSPFQPNSVAWCRRLSAAGFACADPRS